MKKSQSLMRQLFFKYMAQTSPAPLGLEIQMAEGVFLYAKDGSRYIDLISGVSVSNIGHGNIEVANAIKEQVDKHLHLMVYGEIIQAPQVLLAELLVANMPKSLDTVYYVNSGSEANEAALKLAKRITGRRELVSCKNAYHGSTHGALSMMGSETLKNSFRPLLPDVRHIEYNNFDDLQYITDLTASVIIEPIQGEGGVILPVKGYMRALRNRCTEVGAFLIFDEIQTGFGRCGKLFAFEILEIIPDILTLAKALGGGMPLGAMLCSNKMMEAWQSDPVLGHITTFGGHPVSCAAAYASLKYLLREKLVDKVNAKAERYRKGLEGHYLVKEIRVAGLLIAVDLGDKDLAYSVLYKLLDEGVMTDWFLFQPTSFRIAPPLTITEEEIDISIEKILKALDTLKS